MAPNSDIQREFSRLFPNLPETARISVVCRAGDYAASRIARAVEDCDAHVLNLNVTDESEPGGQVVADLRINRRHVQTVVRSLARYGYVVRDVDNDVTDQPDESLEALKRYLEI